MVAHLHMQEQQHAQHLKIFNSTCVTSSISSEGACLPHAAVVSPLGEAVVENPHSTADAAGGK